MSSIAAAGGLTYLGLDVHRDTISVAVLGPDREAPTVSRIAHDEPSIRRLVAQFPNRRGLRACYEAGPTGYELARLLDRMDVRCQVIAPTLIPTAPGDRVKTDSRDCRRLARLHRAGELVAIRVPTVAEEAVRDLCRARVDLLADRTRARHRLSKFLLRHGQVWRGGATAWTVAHERWLLGQRFDDPALAATYGHYRATLEVRDAQLEAIEADLASWYGRPPFADAGGPAGRLPGGDPPGRAHAGQRGRRLAPVCHRRTVHGLLRADPQRILQRQLHLAGPHHQDRQCPSPHPAGRVRLGLPAPTPSHPGAAPPPGWSRPPRPSPGPGPHSCRLCGRFRRLQARKNAKQLVVIAVARELAGFLWAEMVA